MSFADDLARFSVKVSTRSRDVFVGTVMAALASVQDGSPVTGAPGQPVDTGNLRGAWQSDVQGNVGIVACNAVGGRGVDVTPYAEQIEDGISARSGQPIHFRSERGGAHSVRQTVAGMGRLVESVARELAPNA